ncbi:MAG: hypothetical protein Q8Q59_04165 [Luteolibacter sp.]|jgi:hypothetical protein|nr:hypothetical protein [Luteolibacter sp.]
MKTSSLTLLASLVFIGTMGFFAGRITSPASHSATNAGPAATRSARASGAWSDDATNSGTPRTTRLSALSSAERLKRLETILRGENPLDRNRALLAFIDQLRPGDFEEAVTRFRDLGITDSRLGEYTLLLSAWAKADPLSALAYAKDKTNNRFAMDTILTTWASLDPDAAIRWAQANHTGDGANPHLAGILRSLAAEDPQRATQLLTGMPRSRERGDALDAMLPHLLTMGTEATRAWIEGLSDEALRSGAMTRAAESLAAKDPAGTVAWLLANPGEATQRRMDDIYSAWARKDEQAAMTSLSTLPKGAARRNALRGMVSSVAVTDPAKAMTLMDRFADDVDDDVVRNFIWHSFGNSPAAAISQISRIADANTRNQMYTRAVGRWLERDPAAATTWMQTHPLPSSVKKHFDHQINSQP